MSHQASSPIQLEHLSTVSSKDCNEELREGIPLPDYERVRLMHESRSPHAERFARQILLTCQPYLSKPSSQLSVLDVGCGYGGTTMELGKACHYVIGIDPVGGMIDVATRLGKDRDMGNVEFHVGGFPEWPCNHTFDLIVLDNVFEHLSQQQQTLERIASLLNPGGACFLLTPNRLWPLEVHYRLPFLSYLPLRLANLYLRTTGRGRDYTDCSYTPTYGQLARLCARVPRLQCQFVLPADIQLATGGQSWMYRVGVLLLQRFPPLWWISKSLLVVLRKEEDVS